MSQRLDTDPAKRKPHRTQQTILNCIESLNTSPSFSRMRKQKHFLLEKEQKLKISLKATNIREIFTDEVGRNKIKCKTWTFLKIQKIKDLG